MRRLVPGIIFVLFAVIFHFGQTQEGIIRIVPPENGSKPYYYYPFEVPANAESVEIEYSYDKKGGGNTLDLGVFDSGFDATERTLRGFRGWSGGRRNKIFISKTLATNGYVPGKISGGKWYVILGLYKVVPEGVEVTIKIRINQIDSTLLEQTSRETEIKQGFAVNKQSALPSIFNGLKWFRGDLHIHTFHSDGNWTLPMVLDSATNLGLNFVGLTEHNTFSHHREIDRLASQYPGLLILRGEEVTTYGGHFNTWGLQTNQIIDFRVTPQNQTELLSSVNQIHQSELIASINHPTALCGGCGWTYGDWSKMDAVEIWNGFWDSTDELALTKWDKILQSGKRLSAIGSSDSHEPPFTPRKNGQPSLGEPTNHTGMTKLTQKELLSVIRKGRIWVSKLPGNYELGFSALVGRKCFNQGDLIKVSREPILLNFKARNFPANSRVTLISNGRVIRRDALQNGQTDFRISTKVDSVSYFRVEIRDDENKMLALTNPIYFN